MTDLEICKRIAELEKIGHQHIQYTDRPFIVSMVTHKEYNPLTDDALCFQLMVKHKITMNWHTDEYKAWLMLKAKSYSAAARTANKAICLAIIEANKEKTS